MENLQLSSTLVDGTTLEEGQIPEASPVSPRAQETIAATTRKWEALENVVDQEEIERYHG